MATDAPRQLGPEDKFSFGGPFSYAKAIIKEDVTYPIVPNCPIINVDNPETFNVGNIPVGTFFIMHFQESSSFWTEFLCLRVPDDTKTVGGPNLGIGVVIMFSRTNHASSGGGNVM